MLQKLHLLLGSIYRTANQLNTAMIHVWYMIHLTMVIPEYMHSAESRAHERVHVVCVSE